jgi:hypothetical protein
MYAHSIHMTGITEWFPVRQAVPPCVQISVQLAGLLWLTRSITASSKEKVNIWNGLSLEKLTFPQLTKKLPAFYGNYHVHNGQIFAPATLSHWSSLSYSLVSLFRIIFRRVCKIENVTLIFVILSVCTHGTPRLLLDGFLWIFYIWIFF